MRCELLIHHRFPVRLSPVVQVPFGASKGVVAHAIRMPHDTEIRSFGNGEKKQFTVLGVRR